MYIEVSFTQIPMRKGHVGSYLLTFFPFPHPGTPISIQHFVAVFVVCGFIKLYKHDFEVMKYINNVMLTRAISGL